MSRRNRRRAVERRRLHPASTAVLAAWAVISIAGCSSDRSAAEPLSVVYAFDGAHGAWPRGSLTRGGRTLYGRTSIGGDANAGTIFALEPGSSEPLWVYSFTAGGNNVLGNQPHHNALVLSGDTLLGAALYGGNEDNAPAGLSTWLANVPGLPNPPPLRQTGNGTPFTIGTDGSGYSVVAELDGGSTSPANPHSPPMRAADGTLYGMTAAGGAHGGGTLFAIPPGGTLRILHSFRAADGDQPHGVLVPASTGTALLGTTRHGGTPETGQGAGVIFRFDPVTSEYDVLHTFVAGDRNDGDTNDHGFLTLVDGYAYGLTERGGTSLAGALFRIREDGRDFAVVHSFGGESGDGKRPFGSLVASGGFLYGTTTEGGANDVGLVFRYRPSDGFYEVLASFETATTGALPEDNLVPNEDGSILYGMTQAGGVHDPDAAHYYGTVFAIEVPR